MNYTELIKRAARITWRYKVLWILGVLLALSGGAGSGSNLTYSFGGNSGGMVPSRAWARRCRWARRWCSASPATWPSSGC